MSSSSIESRHRNQSGFTRKRSGFTQKHRGFTLTEILIVITIIGLLVGLLAVAAGPVITSAREFAVTTEIRQMELAVDSFQTKYGFYPPSFEQFRRQSNRDTTNLAFVQTEANQLLPFLNKISANHGETDASPVPARAAAGFRKIDDWWQNVGVNMDQASSLPFWLSGIAQNKQFPLTGGLDNSTYAPAIDGDTVSSVDEYLIVGINASKLIDGATEISSLHSIEVAREIHYEVDLARVDPIGDAFGRFPVGHFKMEYGKTNGDLLYLYRDSGSYVPPFFDTSGAAIPLDRFNPDHPGMAYHFWDGASAVTRDNFANPNTFQLISAGLDGDAGILNEETGAEIAPQFRGDLNSQLPKADDNLCNFAEGRLDKYINEQQ